MKQEPFARRLGIPLARLKNYELARAPIRYELAAKLCEEFDINQRWLACGDVFSKRPYFPLDPILLECIPGRVLFSRAFNLVIGELISESLLCNFLPDHNEPPLGAFAYPLGAASHFVRKRWCERVNQMLEAAVENLPDASFQQLILDVKKLIENNLRENEKFKGDYAIDRRRKEADLKVLFQAFVRGRMARNKGDVELNRFAVPPAFSRELIEKGEGRGSEAVNALLTYSDFLTYTGGRNENPSYRMQKTDISQRIKAARESLGLSQSEAAAKWNLRLQTLQQWEHGRREPRGLYRERIEKILSEIEGSRS